MLQLGIHLNIEKEVKTDMICICLLLFCYSEYYLILLLISLLNCYCCAVTTEALSACHYIPEVRSNVFNILYHALNSENAELQRASHECMKRVSKLYSAVILIMALSSCCSYCESWPGSSDERAAADLWTRLIGFRHRSAYRKL